MPQVRSVNKQSRLRRGVSLIEIIIAMGLLTAAIGVLSTMVLQGYAIGQTSADTIRATLLADEGMEAVRSIRDRSWTDLKIGTYGLYTATASYEGTIPSQSMNNSVNFKIGMQSGTPSNGTIDDIVLYDRALSDAEIQQVVAGTPPANNLVARWQFDEGTGTTAANSVSSSYTGTLVGGPTWVAGRNGLGSALNFSEATAPNAVVDLPDIPPMNNASRLTLGGWIKRATPNSRVLFGKENVAQNSNFDLEAWTDGMMYFQVSSGSGFSWGGYSMNDTGWHHVAQVFDGTQSDNANRLKMYLDGVYINSDTAKWTLAGSADTIDGFTRTVTVSTVDSSTKKIVVTVSWNPQPNRTASVVLKGLLTSWPF